MDGTSHCRDRKIGFGQWEWQQSMDKTPMPSKMPVGTTHPPYSGCLLWSLIKHVFLKWFHLKNKHIFINYFKTIFVSMWKFTLTSIKLDCGGFLIKPLNSVPYPACLYSPRIMPVINPWGLGIIPRWSY